MNDVTREVYRIVGETLRVPPEELRPDLLIRAIPNAESIKMLTVILKVERQFDIEIPDEATFGVATVGDFDELVQTLAAGRSAVIGRC
jgi:acyl carrier protein